MIGDRDRMPSKGLEESEVFEVEARRAFLKNCAKYAAATPPAIALLLSAGDAKAQLMLSACIAAGGEFIEGECTVDDPEDDEDEEP